MSNFKRAGVNKSLSYFSQKDLKILECCPRLFTGNAILVAQHTKLSIHKFPTPKMHAQ